MIKNILITGANGQDGKIILQKLYKRKINLILIDKRFKKKIKRKNINYFEINLKDKKKLEKLFKFYKVDVVLNLASNNPNYRQNSYRKHYLENINNFKNLIDNLIKYKNEVKFILILFTANKNDIISLIGPPSTKSRPLYAALLVFLRLNPTL